MKVEFIEKGVADIAKKYKITDSKKIEDIKKQGYSILAKIDQIAGKQIGCYYYLTNVEKLKEPYLKKENPIYKGKPENDNETKFILSSTVGLINEAKNQFITKFNNKSTIKIFQDMFGDGQNEISTMPINNGTAEMFTMTPSKDKPIYMESYIISMPIKKFKLPYDFPFHNKEYKEFYDETLKKEFTCESCIEKLNASENKENNLKELAYQIIYKLTCIQYIIEKIEPNEDWYGIITEYIDYTVDSFGCVGFGKCYYKDILKGNYFLNEMCNFKDDSRREMIAQFISKIGKPRENGNQLSMEQVNELNDRWIQSMPFEIPFFNKLKDNFAKFPFTGRKTNRFSGTFIASDEEHLLNYFLRRTERLISELDISTLIEEGLVSDDEIQLNKVKLIFHRSKIKRSKLLNAYGKGELEYLNLIENWIEIQKDEFTELEGEIDKYNKTKAKETKPTFPNIFKAGYFDKFINYLKVCGFVNDVEPYQWQEDKETFIAVFWALYQFKTESNRKIISDIGVLDYWNVIYNYFNIDGTDWKLETIRRYGKLGQKHKDNIDDYKNTLGQKLLK